MTDVPGKPVDVECYAGAQINVRPIRNSFKFALNLERKHSSFF